MRSVALVMTFSMKNNFRLTSVAVGSSGVVLICVVGLAVLFGIQFIGPEAGAPVPDRSVLENYLGLVLFTTSFISIGIYASVFAFQSITREKARGSIQALLATPLGVRDIWLGKSLAVFLPGLALSAVLTLAALLAINYIYFIPDMGFIITSWMIVSNFVAVPLVYLALSLLVHMVGLAGRPGTGNAIAQVIMPVMIALMINLAVRDMPSAGSPLFAVILLCVAAVIGIIVLMTRSMLTTERIVLSR